MKMIRNIIASTKVRHEATTTPTQTSTQSSQISLFFWRAEGRKNYGVAGVKVSKQLMKHWSHGFNYILYGQ